MPRINRKDILAAARSFLGTPFHHQGRVRGAGVDCIGLLTGVADLLGYPYSDLDGYSRSPKGTTIIDTLDKNLSSSAPGYDPEAEIGSWLPGDVLIFWYKQPGVPQHAGIATQRGIIHTYADVGFVVEQNVEDFWEERLAKVYWYEGVEEWDRLSPTSPGFRQRVREGVGKMRPCHTCGG